MPQRDHSAHAWAGVLVTGRDSETAGREARGKQPYLLLCTRIFCFGT